MIILQHNNALSNTDSFAKSEIIEKLKFKLILLPPYFAPRFCTSF